jgi:hypothetical protein
VDEDYGDEYEAEPPENVLPEYSDLVKPKGRFVGRLQDAMQERQDFPYLYQGEEVEYDPEFVPYIDLGEGSMPTEQYEAPSRPMPRLNRQDTDESVATFAPTTMYDEAQFKFDEPVEPSEHDSARGSGMSAVFNLSETESNEIEKPKRKRRTKAQMQEANLEETRMVSGLPVEERTPILQKAILKEAKAFAKQSEPELGFKFI